MAPAWALALLLAAAGLPPPAAAATDAVRTGGSAGFLIDAWETEQGLPENSTRQAVQTADGYLWFGTQVGLVRFDGEKFAVSTPANTPVLPSEGIVHLHLDARQRLWVSTLRGLVVSEPGRFHQFRPVAGWTGNYIRSAAENAGTICFTSFDGKAFRVAGDRVEELPGLPGNPANTYYAYVDPRGRIAVFQGQFSGHWENGRWVEAPLAPEVAAGFRGAGPARDGSLLVVCEHECLRFRDGRLVARTRLTAPVPSTWQLTEDSRGDLWLPTWGAGIFRIAPSGEVEHFTTAHGLLSDSFRFVFEDREGNLWAGGGNGGGLIRIKVRAIQTFGFESGIPERAIKAVVEDREGRIVVGTYGKGMARHHRGRWETVAAGGTAGLYVQCLLPDREGRIWIGTYGRGLQVLVDSEFREFAPELTGGRNINALFQDSRGRIWIGGEGLVRADAGSFAAQTLSDGRPIPRVVAFAEAAGGDALWAANDAGLFQWRDGVWREIFDAALRPIRGIQCLRADPDGTLWLGRSGPGLWRLRDQRWAQVGEEHGLAVRVVSNLVDDGAGHLWLGTDRGLFRVARAALERVADGAVPRLAFQRFTPSDGLASYEIAGGYSSTSLRDREGRLWFATPRGVALVDTRRLRLNEVEPPIVVEEVAYIDGGGARQRVAPAAGTPVIVPPYSRKLEVQYAVLSLTAPEKVRLRHRFERDGGLVSEDEQTSRVFQSDLLVPGDYLLAMHAANNDGRWNPAGATVRLRVQAGLWQTPFVRGTGLLLLLAGVASGAWRVARLRQAQQLERSRREQELAAERARLATVLEMTSDFVGFATPEGRVLFVNDAGRRMVGLGTGEDLAARHFRAFHPPAQAARLETEAVPAAIRDGLWSGESALLHCDGREVPVSQVVVAHRDESGRLDYLSTIARDMTERNRAEASLRELAASLDRRVHVRTAELQRANEELEAFVYSVSHDLRGPVRNVTGFLELLGLRYGSALDPEGRRFVATATGEARRMAGLIDDLLELSRVGRSGLRLEPVALGPLLEEVRAELGRETDGRRIEWRIGGLPEVTADRPLLRQVLLNLLGNALKFTRGRAVAEIEVGAGPAPGGPAAGVECWVRDNGAGFNPDYAAKLFGAFQRLHSQREFEGTGVGLAIVKRIIERHGGEVRAEGSPGGGATFRFTLPAAGPPRPAPDDSAAPAASAV